MSLAQNIDRLCFAIDAPLKCEFEELYSSLFGNASTYKKVVAALATKKVGMTRLELIEALGIGSVHVEAHGWSFRGDGTYPGGVQIDLVLDRADNVINICEMEYSANEFVIDKEYAARLGRRLAAFVGVTNTRKAVHLTFVTANGLFRNQYSSRVQSEVTLDDLFCEV